MLNEIGSYDAKTKLPEILRRVEAGESFTITNRGKAIAELIPSSAKSLQKTKLAIESILKAKKVVVGEHDLNQLKNEGRK